MLANAPCRLWKASRAALSLGRGIRRWLRLRRWRRWWSGGPIQGLYDWHDQNGAASELQSRIASIDVEGTIATARVELDNWTGHKFTDMFTLLKTDGQWQIVNKVFYLHPEA